jgi:hypothetical protein
MHDATGAKRFKDEDEWYDHYERETPEQREERRERYQRYAWP